MNQSWKVICKAIEYSLVYQGSESFSFETPDWEEVFEETKKQGISLLIYESVATALSSDLKKRWMDYNVQTICHNVQVLHETGMLVKVLKKADIPFCILKGTAAAVYYPKPINRSNGDIDFIVPVERYYEAKQLLETSGYVWESDKAGDSRHLCFKKQNILFEMHHHFHNDSLNVDAYITRSYFALDMGIINRVEFPMLPKLENGIILLAHIRQHLFVGLGLRQVLDWMMYVNTILDDTFWKEKFQKEATNLRLDKLAITITRLCQKYFGLSGELTWCANADDRTCIRLMISIVQAGNFGTNYGNSVNVEKTIINLRKTGVLRYLQMAGVYNWKACHKYRWLKPLAWIYQIGRFVKQGYLVEKKRKRIYEDVLRSAERYSLLKELELF